MTTVTIYEQHTTINTTKTEFNLLERYILRRMHPASIFAEVAGMLWFVYFIWLHLWQEAIAVALITRLVSLTLTRRADVALLARTALGRLALLHLDPINLSIQALGVVAAIYGLWTHETRVILAGTTVLLLGHLRGWGGVDRHFTLS